MIAGFTQRKQDLAYNLPIPWLVLKFVYEVWKHLCVMAMVTKDNIEYFTTRSNLESTF